MSLKVLGSRDVPDSGEMQEPIKPFFWNKIGAPTCENRQGRDTQPIQPNACITDSVLVQLQCVRKKSNKGFPQSQTFRKAQWFIVLPPFENLASVTATEPLQVSSSEEKRLDGTLAWWKADKPSRKTFVMHGAREATRRDSQQSRGSGGEEPAHGLSICREESRSVGLCLPPPSPLCRCFLHRQFL